MSPTRVSIREEERRTIRAFLDHMAGVFAAARVLDYGCGTKPYRELIEGHGGRYVGFDRSHFPGSTARTDRGANDPLDPTNGWDVVVCTQVIQYWPDPEAELRAILHALRPKGWLLMTGPVNWEEIENEDLVRFTKAGIEKLLNDVGFYDVTAFSRHGIELNDIQLSLGWAATGRAS